MGFLALVVGLKIVSKFANELAPKPMRVWIITDSKYALEKIWGTPCATSNHYQFAEETKKFAAQVGNLHGITFFPAWGNNKTQFFPMNAAVTRKWKWRDRVDVGLHSVETVTLNFESCKPI